MTSPTSAPQAPQVPTEAGIPIVLAAAETAIAAYMVAAYTKWLAAATQAILGGFIRFGVSPDPGAIWSTVPLWERVIDELLNRLSLIARAGWMDAGRQLGVDLPYKADDPILVDQLLRTRNLMVRTVDEVYRQVIKALGESAAAGETVEDQVKRVRHVLDVTGTENWPARARTVAVTECFPTEVLVDGADVLAAYRRWYEGDMVTVVAENGNRITGTPNHPVLTLRGWVGLGHLSQEDRLVCDNIQSDGSFGSRNPDVETTPSTIGKIFDSLQAVGVSGRISGGEPDFHGDGADGDIDVSAPDGFLSYGVFSELCQCRVNLSLEPAALSHALLAAQGAPFSYLRALEQDTGFPGLDTLLAENAADGMSPASQLLGQILHAVPGQVLLPYILAGYLRSYRLGVTSGADVGTSDPQFIQDGVDRIDTDSKSGRDDGHRGPRPVEVTNIRSMSTSTFAGHVYNLSTVQGYFAAQGFFVGNTHRAWNFGALAASMRIQQSEQQVIFKTWSAKDDSATRPGHKRADGQTVPINQPFIVNLEPLMMPGDPAGSPSNIISCRCKPLFRRTS